MCQLRQDWNRSQISAGRPKQPCHKPHHSGTTLNKSLSAANHVSVRSSAAPRLSEEKMAPDIKSRLLSTKSRKLDIFVLMDGIFHCLRYVEGSCRLQSHRSRERERGRYSTNNQALVRIVISVKHLGVQTRIVEVLQAHRVSNVQRYSLCECPFSPVLGLSLGRP